MNELLHVSSSPHVRSKVNTSNIMLMVVIALMPATIFGIINFGPKALLLVLISVATCVLSEGIYEHFMHKPVTVRDYSAVITGLLLALNLPVGVPWWMPIIGGVFAIIIVKQLFGGLGQNFMNPALAGRCFLLISFTGLMTDFSVEKGAWGLVDTVSGATPLAAVKAGESVDVMRMFLGNTQGTIGETSVIAYIVTFLVFIILFGGHGFDLEFIGAHLCGGGLMLGAWFMATDYVTTPITKKGQIVYGIILGILTGLFRIFGGSAEGVSYAIIFSNLLIPIIERFTRPTAFGKGGKK